MRSSPRNLEDDDPPSGAGSPLTPAAAGERLQAVDVLRGFALFGLLPVNIFIFALPRLSMSDPLLDGGAGIHFATWVFVHVFFELKFMAIFSLLYGAGIVLMSERAELRGGVLGWIFYRRMSWLALFGVAHAYLVWSHDILLNYALCGMLAYPLRKLRPRTLIVLGILASCVSFAVILGIGSSRWQQRATAESAEARLAAGETLTADEERARASWVESQASKPSDREEVERELEVFRGGYRGIFEDRLPLVVAMQTVMWLALASWRTIGLMLFGMALMKLGFLSTPSHNYGDVSLAMHPRPRRYAPSDVAPLRLARKPCGRGASRTNTSPYFWSGVLRNSGGERSYGSWALAGIGLGLPIVLYGVYQLIVRDFDPFYYWGVGAFYNYLGSIPLGLGYVALGMLAVRRGAWPGLRARLAAVGRMTLTGYLVHSILFTTIFYGYGLGLYGHVDRFYLMGFVLAVWLLQLYLCPWWLEHFRFGPFEWLWRSLTYWRRQPMRIRAVALESANPDGVASDSPG